MLKVTIDTNTLISAAISHGNEFLLLKAAQEDKLQLVLSPDILEEFKEVLARPKFGFSEEQVMAAFKQLVSIASIVVPTAKCTLIKDDPDDNRILECAEEGNVGYIVSGDKHLLNLKQYKSIKIVKSAEMLNLV